MIFIQHVDDGSLTTGSDNWDILSSLEHLDTDLLLCKHACGSFYETELPDLLKQQEVHEIIITGCARNFYVDITIRVAASRNYEVMVPKGWHTTKYRSHLDAKSIIVYYNWMWKNLILPRNEVKVIQASSVINWLQSVSRSYL